jgi:RNA polymerase sigma factor (sigma-70 family)
MTATFLKLIDHNTGRLRRFAYQLTRDQEAADDLFQDTLTRIIQNEEKFRSDTNFAAWSQTIMRNLYINQFRIRKRRTELATQSDRKVFSSANDTVDNEAESILEMEFLQKIIAELDESYRTPFLMYYQGFHYDEIAEKLEAPLGTIKSRIHWARKILKKKILDYRDN